MWRRPCGAGGMRQGSEVALAAPAPGWGPKGEAKGGHGCFPAASLLLPCSLLSLPLISLSSLISLGGGPWSHAYSLSNSVTFNTRGPWSHALISFLGTASA
jgi:hypothetical protein